MNKSIIFSTKNNNYYLYNMELSLSLLIHPDLEKAFNKSKDIDPYYTSKYSYLKNNGFFKNIETVEFGNTLEEDIIKKNITDISQIVFETTDHCNLNCQYCSLGELYTFSKKERRNINTQYAVNFLKYIFDIKKDGTDLAIGFFGGEPLLNIGFIKIIIDEAKHLNIEKKLNLEFTMTTNATLIDQHIDLLAKNKFRLLISLDGDKKGHSYRTSIKDNKNSFQQVVKNIDIIQQDYPEYFADKIEFNAVLHNRNSVKEIYEFIYNKYHKIPRISSLNTDHINPCKKDLLGMMFCSRRESEEEFQKEKSNLLPIMHDQLISFKELKSFLVDYSINFYLTNILDLLYDKAVQIPTKTCSPFQRKMYFNTYNLLLPCEKVSYKYSIGKVNDDVFIDIHGTVRRYNFYYEQIEKVCQFCYNRRTCSTCLLMLDNLDKLDTKEFICPNFFNENAFGDKLHHVFSFLEANTADFLQITDNNIDE